MAGYDSSSSLSDDDKNYSETNVLLGYASREATGDIISRLGGQPSWLDPVAKPSGAYAKCKVCQSYMSLLLQLNGDLPEHFPHDERRLYIFSCRKKTCSRKAGSVRAIREVRRSKSERSQHTSKQGQMDHGPERSTSQSQQDLGAALFGSTSQNSGNTSANPFSLSSNNSTSSSTNPFAPLPSTSTLAAKAPQAPASAEQAFNANPFASLPPTSTLAAKPPQVPADLTTDKKVHFTLSESFASKLRVSSSSPSSEATKGVNPTNSIDTTPWPQESDFPPPYPSFYLDADYESLTVEPLQADTNLTATSSKIQYEDESETTTSGPSSNTKDTFESSLDKTFLRFSDRLAQNPEQVLRYEWKGTPLLYSSTDAVASRFPSAQHSHSTSTNKITTATTTSASSSSNNNNNNKIPRCEHCSSDRVFELQLVPGLISALEEEDDDDDINMDLDSGMEWGTVILGVCARNCSDSDGDFGKVAWREEWIGVQWEERMGRK